MLNGRFDDGLVNEQRINKRVVPLQEYLATLIRMKVVADLWLSMVPRQRSKPPEEWFGRKNVKDARLWPNSARRNVHRWSYSISFEQQNLDRDTDAIAEFDRALAIDPEFPGARDWRARAAAAAGETMNPEEP